MFASKRKLHQDEIAPFDPPPVLRESTILSIGIIITVLAWIWLPLVPVATLIASKVIPALFKTTDDATTRRMMYHRFLQDPKVADSLPHISNNNATLQERLWINSRGMALMTSIMMPKDRPVRAVILFCHGYSDHASFVKRRENLRLVREGFAVVSIEYEGHGRSDGPSALIYDWNQTVADVVSFFEETIDHHFAHLRSKCFLMGESMGGAICFCSYQRRPDLFAGIVFVAPMCKISDKLAPPPIVKRALLWIAGPVGSSCWGNLLPYLPIAPVKNVSKSSVRIESKRHLMTSAPVSYTRKPRLATARELSNATEQISRDLPNLDAPFLIIHGKDDRVTDPALSQALYEEAKSNDKTLKLYDGMWHGITGGESDENIAIVFKDIIAWVSERSF